MYRENLMRIIGGQHLDAAEMSAMIDRIFSGDVPDTRIAAFMAALATKGETDEELAGAALAMRRRATRVQSRSPTVVDTCGTGGDGANTFNISTITAFVVAACGVTVAKHGNRAISSRCGSADLLETLGVKIDIEPEIVEEALAEIGIGFLFAPVYHSAMKHAATARKELGIRSIFNMLGPLTNPAAANCQLLGVYAPELTEMFARALKCLGARRAFVVHGHDGLDEISICAPTRVSQLGNGAIRTFDIIPEQLFGETADPKDLSGGRPQENAEIVQRILSGERGPQRNVILINAAAALIAADVVADLQSGIAMAADHIDNGDTAAKLDALIRFTRENG